MRGKVWHECRGLQRAGTLLMWCPMNWNWWKVRKRQEEGFQKVSSRNQSYVRNILIFKPAFMASEGISLEQIPMAKLTSASCGGHFHHNCWEYCTWQKCDRGSCSSRSWKAELEPRSHQIHYIYKRDMRKGSGMVAQTKWENLKWIMTRKFPPSHKTWKLVRGTV